LRFTEAPLAGAFVIDIEPIEDERGFFARTWCQREGEERGLNPRVMQCSMSFNRHAGTIRGMHYQIPPHAEAKLVRCTAGVIYDVIIDLRADSLTYRQWFSAELGAANRKALYIPEGFAHGFQTLEANSEVVYQISESYAPECARGIRWNDPAFNIRWPLPVSMISEKDKFLCNYSEHVTSP
jgi:dTDP-4-dehydrorhamnose 3,5-epimerase